MGTKVHQELVLSKSANTYCISGALNNSVSGYTFKMKMNNNAQTINHTAALAVEEAKKQANKLDVTQKRRSADRLRDFAFSRKSSTATSASVGGLIRNVSCLFRRSRGKEAGKGDICKEEGEEEKLEIKTKNLKGSVLLQRSTRISREKVRPYLASNKNKTLPKMKVDETCRSVTGFDGQLEAHMSRVNATKGTENHAFKSHGRVKTPLWKRHFVKRTDSHQHHDQPSKHCTSAPADSLGLFRQCTRPQLDTTCNHTTTLTKASKLPAEFPFASSGSTFNCTTATSQDSLFGSLDDDSDEWIGSGSLGSFDSLISQEDLALSVGSASKDSFLESKPFIHRLQLSNTEASDITDRSDLSGASEVTEESDTTDIYPLRGRSHNNLRIDADIESEQHPDVEVSLVQPKQSSRFDEKVASTKLGQRAIKSSHAVFAAVSPTQSISETLEFFQSSCTSVMPDMLIDTYKIPRTTNFPNPMFESLLPINYADSESICEDLDSRRFVSNDSDDLYHRLINDDSFEHDDAPLVKTAKRNRLLQKTKQRGHRRLWTPRVSIKGVIRALH